MPGFACDRTDFDDAIVNLRNFYFKQPSHEIHVGPRKNHTNPRTRLANIQDSGAHTIRNTVSFLVNLFTSRQYRFNPAKIDDHSSPIDAGDSSRNDLTLQIQVLVVVSVSLGFTDLLDHHLLCRLR